MTFVAKFLKDARVMAGDLRHRKIIRAALGNYEIARDKRKASFQSWESARQLAAETKWDALNHLDKYLVEFVAKIEARGTKVHWASTAAQAREIILQIVRDKKAKSVIKSKAMTAEEIHLNDALEHAGLNVVENDLGEFIVQLRHEAPYHIVFPSMHLTRADERSRRTHDDRPARVAQKISHGGHRHHRREFRHRRDRHDFHHGKRRQRASHRRAAEDDDFLARHRKNSAEAGRPCAVSADARDGGNGPAVDGLQHDVWRPAPARRKRRPGRMARRAARQSSHGAPRRRRAT